MIPHSRIIRSRKTTIKEQKLKRKEEKTKVKSKPRGHKHLKAENIPMSAKGEAHDRTQGSKLKGGLRGSMSIE